MFREILFPVDFSERCRRFAPEVALVAKELQAKVTLLYVIELSYMLYTGPEAPVYSSLVDLNMLRESAEGKLTEWRYTHFAGVETLLVQREGSPAEQMLEYAQKQGIDLIMMPTHGCGVFRRTLLGSVTAKVLHDSTIPVWTDTHQKLEPAAPAHLPKSIVAAVDESERSIAVMQWGETLARQFRASFAVIHAVPDAAALRARYSEAAATATQTSGPQQHIQDLQATAGTSGEIYVKAGKVASVVCHEAAERQADLLVIGRGHLQEHLGSLRTHIYTIIQQAPCPVLSV